MKLDVLRRYRAQLEEVVRMDLFQLRKDLHEAEARARLLNEHMRLTTDAYLAKAEGVVALDEFLVWQSRFQAGTSLLAQARQEEVRLSEAWSQKQNELRDAVQDRRTVDRLAERMRQQRQLVQDRIDQMEMDEAARRTSVM
ncbi:MAG: flagellar FliJ family protein [Nitrospirota bacterium]|jgi:flagellar export protein FliJ